MGWPRRGGGGFFAKPGCGCTAPGHDLMGCGTRGAGGGLGFWSGPSKGGSTVVERRGGGTVGSWVGGSQGGGGGGG